MDDDTSLFFEGTEIVVEAVNHLEVQLGKPNADAPTKEWFAHPDLNEPSRDGHFTIKQRHTGCVALIRKDNVKMQGIFGHASDLTIGRFLV